MDQLIVYSPYKNIKNAIKVESGTHFMIANKYDIISSLINNELKG